MTRLTVSLVVLTTLLPVISSAQNISNCVPSSPENSNIYKAFLTSDLAAKWSVGSFGPLELMSGGKFLECSNGSTADAFSMIISDNGKSSRALGVASKGGQQRAVVFQVEETASGTYNVQAFDVTGEALFQFNIGSSTGEQFELIGGRHGCSGIYLRDMAGVAMGTAGAGPAGFAVGMAVMVYDLWDNGCL